MVALPLLKIPRRYWFNRILRLIAFNWRRMAGHVKNVMPKGLYGRTLLIFITPMVILQSVVAFVFMERHWQTVTFRLSQAVSRDIAAIIAIYENYPHLDDYASLIKLSQDKLQLNVSFLPNEDLPAAGPKPFFTLLDSALTQEISRNVGRPFWIDTIGRSNLVEIRIKLDNTVMRILARRNQTYASNSHIFLVWMVGTSLVLLIISIIFLRNQIKPIQALAFAAEKFGKGQDVVEFRPRGAREVRQAAAAFIDMRTRIERQIEQRTAMLSGVSHDLRTILTRFRLQIALSGDGPENDDLLKDVDEMQHMLEDYLSFARGDQGEVPAKIDLAPMLEEICANAATADKSVKFTKQGDIFHTVRPRAFKRCVGNLVTNAVNFGGEVEVHAKRGDHFLTITVDDNGIGIPKPQREDAFKPFHRLDDARNQNIGGTGLGLAIARDIARGHGGDIRLEDSPLGGLRATLEIPV
ncbi:MAG: hypothetical protein K8F25_00475 [Fimbriimonadaceae bacterium]|nr:hypothetical protein [Alphaproteobacteria bacterium]